MTSTESVFALIASAFAFVGLIEARVQVHTKRLVKEYLSELKPNGGGSVKDQVNRLEQNQEKMSSRIDDLFTLLIGKNKE